MRKKRRWDEEFCKMCEKKGGLGGKLGCFAVAPYAGAWIEMHPSQAFLISGSSLPTRERGLKLRRNRGRISLPGSLPTRERGLKYCFISIAYAIRWSLPTRERGLK